MAPQLPYLPKGPQEAKCIMGNCSETTPAEISVLMYLVYTAVMPGSLLTPMKRFVSAGVGPLSVTLEDHIKASRSVENIISQVRKN